MRGKRSRNHRSGDFVALSGVEYCVLFLSCIISKFLLSWSCKLEVLGHQNVVLDFGSMRKFLKMQ